MDLGNTLVFVVFFFFLVPFYGVVVGRFDVRCDGKKRELRQVIDEKRVQGNIASTEFH